MSDANAQRMLGSILVIIEFISQPHYKDPIPMFGIVNEAYLPCIGLVTSLYLQAHNMIRGMTDYGADIHGGFLGTALWAGFLTHRPRHTPALCVRRRGERLANHDGHASLGGTRDMAEAGVQLLFVVVEYKSERVRGGDRGEFSNGYNDYGLYLSGVNGMQRYGGDCSLWQDASASNHTAKAGVK